MRRHGMANVIRMVRTKELAGGQGQAAGPQWLVLSLAPALLALSLPLLGGCETSCSVDADEEPELVTSGNTDLEAGTYESAPWDGKFHVFPPKKRYAFQHGLPGVPRDVSTWVSFHERPLVGRAHGDIAESAGNIVIIERVDETTIQVRNDTCETFYLRVFASDPAPAGS